MLISERLWVMSLDDRGLPRHPHARVCVTVGLLLDLAHVGAIEWRDDTIVATGLAAPSANLLRWAKGRVDVFDRPISARFVVEALHPGAWEQAGRALAEQGFVTMRKRALRRRPRFFAESGLRQAVVREARTALFDEGRGSEDPVLAVLGAAGIGDELLSFSPFTDDGMAEVFADRDPSALERQVDDAIAYALVPFFANGYYST